MYKQMSLNVRKGTFWAERHSKTQISLRIRSVWSVFDVRKNTASLTTQNTPSEDWSDCTITKTRIFKYTENITTKIW